MAEVAAGTIAMGLGAIWRCAATWKATSRNMPGSARDHELAAVEKNEVRISSPATG